MSVRDKSIISFKLRFSIFGNWSKNDSISIGCILSLFFFLNKVLVERLLTAQRKQLAASLQIGCALKRDQSFPILLHIFPKRFTLLSELESAGTLMLFCVLAIPPFSFSRFLLSLFFFVLKIILDFLDLFLILVSIFLLFLVSLSSNIVYLVFS